MIKVLKLKEEFVKSQECDGYAVAFDREVWL